ncbi:Helix-turn-helix domain-containing protein [Actinopolyspora xinjiangensis]|uniref:Helix-turn-helix domain-containing protein n=1 Tax=Actinopolyspora xinjiangensis TaxID=405564 RepID=A0A1H0X0E1_9ACTN|nr:helix-turn-helix transcriptional regulator [Actinopolyspora xinjiangensis]SDP96421.1 Helix-turn-helix domain-containing protein [Actinopolyspora xinjiangensis]
MARKTIRARRLGKQIRKLRERAGFNQDQLCEAINAGQERRASVSQGQLSKIEVGAARLDATQLERILTAVGANEDTAARLETLRARAEEPGWWSEYSPYIHETLELTIELGEDARAIRTYDTSVVQGLLQTEDYARTIIESSRAWVRPTDVDMLVELRMRRQKRLADDDFGGLTAVITEASLRHQVGSRAVMRAQLEKLCQITEEGTAAVHVLPYEEGPWPGLGGFLIYSFPDEEDAEVVQVDGDLGAGIYEDREPISALTYTFNAALAKALPARESLNLYRTVMKELDT